MKYTMDTYEEAFKDIYAGMFPEDEVKSPVDPGIFAAFGWASELPPEFVAQQLKQFADDVDEGFFRKGTESEKKSQSIAIDSQLDEDPRSFEFLQQLYGFENAPVFILYTGQETTDFLDKISVLADLVKSGVGALEDHTIEITNKQVH